MANLMEECHQMTSGCSELQQLMHNPMFSTLRETLASDVIQQCVPYTLVQGNPPTKEQELVDLQNFDLVVEDATLQAEFRQLSSLSNHKVAELEGFYNTQSASIITQQSDALSKAHAAGYSGERLNQELKYITDYYNNQQAHLTMRISKSLQLLKLTLPLELAQPGGATKKNKSRNLCGKAVKIMHDWYESHLNHPYPTDEEKLDMAQAGGLNLAQVKAWFANKRNRSLNTKPKRKKLKLQQQLNSFCQDLTTPDVQNPVGTMDAYSSAPPTYSSAPPTYSSAPPIYNSAPPTYNSAPPKSKARRYDMLINELSTMVNVQQKPYAKVSYPPSFPIECNSRQKVDYSHGLTTINVNTLQAVI